jgi:hypothetical protein
MSYKNYNIFALRGDTETSDADICDQLGLDPSLAGTPAINEAAIKQMHRENFNSYLQKGYSEDDAMKLANEHANNTRSEIKQLLK